MSSAQTPAVAAATVARTTSCTEDPDNSSSAYQTGGSCNSTNNATPLTLELTHSHPHSSQSTLVLNTPASSSATLLVPQFVRRRSSNSTNNTNPRHNHQPQQNVQTMLRPNQSHSNFQLPSSVPNSYLTNQSINQHCSAQKQNQSTAYYYSSANQPPIVDSSSGTLPNADTMYTNMANLQQTMLLQQRLFRQAMAGRQAASQELPGQSNTAIKFTAPSLSQYQFVSGSQQQHSLPSNAYREHSSVPPTSSQGDQHPRQQQQRMEWKVKRRQDGTRYIVRRPVRSDRSAAIRAHVESMAATVGGRVEGCATTTEDDTMSEVKIGRYWTKEERKKHYEKSRERRAAAANNATATAIAHKQELLVIRKGDVRSTEVAAVNCEASLIDFLVENNNNTNNTQTIQLSNSNARVKTVISPTTLILDHQPDVLEQNNTPPTTPSALECTSQTKMSPTNEHASDGNVIFPAGPVDEIVTKMLSVTTV